MDVRLALAAEGGVAPAFVLEQHGITPRAMQRAVDRSLILRVRSGWYALMDTPVRILEAARTGGAAGCVSGLTSYRVWSPPGEPLHVALPRNARRIRAAPGTIVHWTGIPRSTFSLASLEECVRVSLRCVDAPFAFAIVESALRRRSDLSWMPRLLETAPLDRRDILRQARAVSESGTESVVAYHLTRLGIRFMPQVTVPGVGRVDFVLGDRMIIEADSEEHHGKPDQRRRDLDRDALAAALGFTTLRLDYTQVLFDWPLAEAAIRSTLAHGDHRAHLMQLS